MRSLWDVLVNDYGLSLSGWWLAAATGVSDDGKVIVGVGVNPAGDEEACSRLESLGFRPTERQPAVSMAIQSFDPEFDATQVAESLYLTMADTGRV